MTLAPTISALVLAAGSSTRLGQPKQVLPLGDSTLLDQTLQMVRQCRPDQIVVALGGGADDVLAAVDLSGCDVAVNREFTTGCSSSIVTALATVQPSACGFVLFLGDQPFVLPANVRQLVVTAASVDMGVCRYDDGLGHPLWFARSMFVELATLHGDKAVWKLLSSDRFRTVEVVISGVTPLDVDTWDDYERARR